MTGLAFLKMCVARMAPRTTGTCPKQYTKGFDVYERRGDVAQLVEHRTGTLPTQVRFPGAARDFFSPESAFSADSLKMTVRTRVKYHAFTFERTLNIP